MRLPRQSKFISEVERVPLATKIHLRYPDYRDSEKMIDDGTYSIVSCVTYEEPVEFKDGTTSTEVSALFLLESPSGLRNRALEIDQEGDITVCGDGDADPSEVSRKIKAPAESIPVDELVTISILQVRGEKSDVFIPGEKAHQIFFDTKGNYTLLYVPARPGSVDGAKPYLTMAPVGHTDVDPIDPDMSWDGRPLKSYFKFVDLPFDDELGSADPAAAFKSATGASPASPFPALNAKAFEAPSGGGNSTKVFVFLILLLILGALIYYKV